MKKNLRTIDLFAGIGGVRKGFEKAGFKTVFANDNDPKCKITYDFNFSSPKLTIADIRKINTSDLPRYDFLLAGFPCQAFSIAGYRKGFMDPRGNLFFEIARILDNTKPTGLFLENVKNLQGHDNKRTFRIIIETLEKKLGYYIKYKVLNSVEYGNTPQNRERIYIVGFKKKAITDRFEFPSPQPLTKTFRTVLQKSVDQKYYYEGKPLYKQLSKYNISEKTVYQWRRVYIRENKRGICPTLTANMGTGGHNVPIIRDRKGIRRLTPLECARLQGFPPNFKLPNNLPDSTLYKQFGNSVTVSVIEAIAKQIIDAINTNVKTENK